jgi:hypothetical protein
MKLNAIRQGFLWAVILLWGATSVAVAQPIGGSWHFRFAGTGGGSVGISTDNPEHDLVTAFKRSRALLEERYEASGKAGTTYVDEQGRAWPIGSIAPAGAKARKSTLPTVADSCAIASIETTGPIRIDNSLLPYDASFDASAATDDGDFRGSSADSISSAGGKDAFWKFEPTVSGIYSITVTAGTSAGVGVWEGACGALTEVGTAFNLFGGGSTNLAVRLEANQSYYIVWEDFFPGSIENEVRLQVTAPQLPQGETAAVPIDLSGEHWGLGFSAAADNSANTNTLHFPSAACAPDLEAGSGHGGNAGDGNDVWFRLPPVKTGVTYRLEGHAGTMTNSIFVLYSHAAQGETVANLVIEQCNDDKANSGGHDENDFMSLLEFTGDATRVYYLFVESYSLSGPGDGSFTLEGTSDPAETETKLIENFNLGAGFAAAFVDTDVDGETPQATSATLPAHRLDRGLDSGKWGGYVTTGSLYMYNFTGSTYETTTSVQTGYMLKTATSADESGSYLYTYFPSSRIDLSYDAADISWVNRYGGAMSTTATLRLLLRSAAETGHGTPGLWMISEPFTVTGLTGSFSTNPVQHLSTLRAKAWYSVSAPDRNNLDALANGDEQPITIGSAIPHGVQTLLSEVDGVGFYIAADLISSGSSASGLFFDSVVLKGVLQPVPSNAVGNWSTYE